MGSGLYFKSRFDLDLKLIQPIILTRFLTPPQKKNRYSEHCSDAKTKSQKKTLSPTNDIDESPSLHLVEWTVNRNDVFQLKSSIE